MCSYSSSSVRLSREKIDFKMGVKGMSEFGEEAQGGIGLADFEPGND